MSFLIRLYQIEELPPGMWGDEVSVAKYSLELLSQPQIIPYSNSYFHPTPILYLNTLFMSLFGVTITSIRLANVIFGALDIVLFYILLRQFFRIFPSVIGSIIMTFSYTHIVISRMAYEQTASIFFEILSVLFLYLAYKTKKIKYVIGIGLSLGIGLHTYFSFRIYAVVFLLLSVIIISYKKDVSGYIKNCLIIFAGLFTSSSALISYALLHPDQFWSRPMQISILNQNLPMIEIFKEFSANILRFLGSMLGFVGDPNPRHNPSGVPLFDPFLVIFAVIGIIWLFKKQRNMFYIVTVLVLPFLMSDILSLEKIPEFHYYGLGHPHTLRISGVIPILIFLSVLGIKNCIELGEKLNIYLSRSLIVISVILMIFLNIIWFFHQKSINPSFYLFNYQFNHGKLVKISKEINNSSQKNFYISNNKMGTEYISFFITDKNKKIKRFNPYVKEDVIKNIRKDTKIIIDVNENSIDMLNGIYTEITQKQQAINVKILQNPIKQQETVIFSSN